MLTELKHTLKHISIYSVGNIATKMIGVVLIPLYTKYISVSEYGVLSVLDVTILIASEFLLFGLTFSYLRFHEEDEFKNRTDTVQYSLMLFLFLIGVLVLILGQFVAPQIAGYFSDPSQFAEYFRLMSFIIFFRIQNNFFLNVLRTKEKSFLYIIANITKLIVVLALIIYFVSLQHSGIMGVLQAYLIGDALLFLILIPFIILHTRPGLDWQIVFTALVFGFPLIFNSVAGMVANLGDRYILKYLVNYHEVGLYDLGYKIAGLINIFIIKSFSLGFLPQAFKIYGTDNDRRYYSKILTYLVFVLVWSGLTLSIFSKGIVESFALDPKFWPAQKVIPVVVFAYVFSGASNVVSLGMLLKKKTVYLAAVTVATAALNVMINFLIIPQYGMMGAAFATLISYSFQFVISYLISQQLYRIPFEIKKFMKMILTGGGLYLLFVFSQPIEGVISWIIKVGIILLFPLLLYLVRFYEDIELERIKGLIRKF